MAITLNGTTGITTPALNNSYIDDSGTGQLLLRASLFNVQKYTGETMATFLADGAVTLYHNNAIKLATTATGISVTGDITPTGGVYLGGTGSANHLDDYEEGTWTPSVGGSAGYNSQVGKYTKVGNMVTVWFNQYLATIGTGSTTTLSGLPFAVSNIAEFNVNGNQLSYFTGLNGTYTFVAAYVLRNATTIGFVTVGGSGASSSSVDTAVLQSNCDIYGNITYRTG
jgi:hypothetical protein